MSPSTQIQIEEDVRGSLQELLDIELRVQGAITYGLGDQAYGAETRDQAVVFVLLPFTKSIIITRRVNS